MTDTPDLKRRNLLIGGALLATAGIAYAKTPREAMSLLGKSKLENKIPRVVGGWQYQTTRGLVLPPSDQLKEGIYNDLLTRVYTRPDGKVVMLLIAYVSSQEGSLQVHRPEICYPASGYTIISNVEHDIAIPGRAQALPTRLLVAEGDSREEQLVYWTRVGNHFPRRWLEQRTATMQSRLEGVIPDGILVRISTVEDDLNSAALLVDDFARNLITSVDPQTRRAIAGGA